MANLEFPTPKKASAIKLYQVRFERWLAPVAGDTLTGATVTAAPAGLTISNVNVTATSVLFKIADGLAGQYYRLDIAITTAQGQADTKSVFLRVVA